MPNVAGLIFDEELKSVQCAGCGREEPLPPYDQEASHRWPTSMELLPAPLLGPGPGGETRWIEVIVGVPPWDAALGRFDEKHRACMR